MKKRVFSFLMAAMILFSAVPAEAFAAGSSEAEELYFIDDTIWLAEGEEPSAPVVETGKWVKTEETKTASVLCCSEEEHTHLQNCPVADDGSFACGGHIHTDSCYAKVYDHDAHTHTEECSADAACTLQEHIHTDECAFVLGELTCGQAEHTHVTNGCEADCALAEHSHGEACQQTVTLVKWVVTLKEDSYTPHAADSRITDGVGTVVISGHIDWNELDSSCRPSAVEVYLYADNVRIAAQTVTAPGWAYSFDISKGVPDGKGGYTSPIGVNFEIREQELPGYNKPAIVHPVLNFTPPSAGSGWIDQNPCSKLEWHSSDGSYAVIAAKTTSSGPLIIWTPFALAEFEREIILTSLKQNASGLGNPKSTLFLSGEGVQSDYGLTADSSTLEFKDPSVWSKFWTGSYSQGYTDVTGSSIVYTQKAQQITVKKVWNDANDLDGIRPDNVVVHLLKNSLHEGNPVTLNESNGWEGSWTVPTHDKDGIPYIYHVEEVIPQGYTCQVSGSAETGFTLTNIHTPEKVSVVAHKIWEDDENRDGLRPDSVTVQLYRQVGENGTKTAVGSPVSIEAANYWTYEWDELDAHSNGTPIIYSVEETRVSGYNEPRYTTDEHTGRLVITNSRDVGKINVAVNKVWNDQNNRDGIRPDKVTVTLYANGIPLTSEGTTVELSAANGWSHTWTGLYEYYQSNKIAYTVAEAVPNGYTAVTTGNASTGYTITNTHTPETISVPVNKVWNDGDNQDGIRPASVEVKLLADGQATDETLTLNAANNWAGSFDNMPKYKAGAVKQAITYTVVETSVPEGYTAEVTGTAENGYTVTNSHTPMVATLTVNKVWNDANDQDGKRPEEVTVTLYANGHPLIKGADGKPDFSATTGDTYTLTLRADDDEKANWTGSWQNMPRYHNGQRVSYTVVETGHDGQPGLPAGYTVTYQYAGTDTTNGTATITNSYTPEQTSINVQKVWDDEDNRDGKRPESITVTLWQKIGNGEWTATDRTAVLNAANEWDHDFTGLPKYYNGTEILYNVVETTNDTDYLEAEYAYDPATGVVTVTNKRTVERTSVSVTKVWDDANNQDGKRPASVEVTLYANGYELTAEGTTVTLKASNNWTYTWNNLYKNYRGQPIVYTVAEQEVAEGYTASVNGTTDENGDVAVTITNTHTPEKVDIPVSKAWEDEDNRDSLRPEAVEVTLYADGEATERTLILSMHNNWQAVFTGLDKYRLTNGASQPITYTVVESGHYDKYDPAADNEHNVRSGGVPEGYTPAYNGYTITNTHAVELTAFTVVKQWNDDGNRDGKRPASINLHLLANGIHMNEQFPGEGYMVSLTSAAQQPDTWQYTWNDLYKNRGGQAIRYTVYEEPIYPADSSTNTIDANGEPIAPQAATLYTTTYVRNSDTQDTVINTYVPETVAVTVTKIWDDGNDRDGLRPESITVTLCGDGAAAETATLNAANNWSYSWTALPKYKDGGTPIVYTVQEPAVPEGYTCAIKKDHGADAANGNAVPNYHYFVMTNTHVPETTSVSVTKKWNDDDNNDGKRPDGLIVQLFADGSEVPNGMAVLSAINNWSYTWPADMPLYVYKTTWDDTGAKSTGNIRYSVREIGYVMGSTEYTGLPDGYTGTDIMEGFNVTLTNTRESEKVSVEVSKVWDDGNDRDAIRPASVQVTLKKNGTAVETVTLDASNGWAYKWDNLKRYDGGAIADYTVEEAAVESYTVSYSKVADASGNVSVTITNTHEPATHGGGGGGDSSITKTVIVSKVWEDNSNIEGLRPQRVVLRLYKNGKAYGDKIVLSDANCWNKAVTLPVYEDGNKIQWTVRELKIPRYYTVSYNQRSLTVTNTLQSKTIPKTGDTSNLLLWLLLMGVCGAGMCAVLLLNNKKKRYRR